MLRRLFLASLFLLASYETLAWGQTRLGIRVVPSAGSVLTQSDFTYVCTFKPPGGLGEGSPLPEGIFTGKRDGSTVTFFHKESAHLIEFSAPGTCSAETVNEGTLVTDWGNVWAGKTVNAAGDPIEGIEFTQLFWDDVNGGIYTEYSDNYNVAGNHNPSLLFTTLDDPGTEAFTTYGPWMLNVAPQQTNRVLARIPSGSSFPATYLSGKTLLIGGIGISSGDASSSWGPVVFTPATELDTEAAYPTTATVSMTRLVGYSHANKAPHPSTDWVIHPYDGTPDEEDKWHQLEGSSGSGVWIKTASKEGMVFFGAYGTGHIWYGLAADVHTDPETLTTLTFNNTSPATIVRSSGSWLDAFAPFEGRSFAIEDTAGGLNDKNVIIPSITDTTLTLAEGETLVAQGPSASGTIYARGCGHNLSDPCGFSTGPHSSEFRKARVFIYDPAELGRVVNEEILSHNAAWSSSFNLADVGGQFNGCARPVQGSWYDSVTGKLYVSSPEMSGAFLYVPYINVYQIADSAPSPAFPLAAMFATVAGGLLTRRRVI